MAKKKEDTVETVEPTKETKKEEKGTTPKKGVEKFTLIELINDLEDSDFIFEKLMKHGYYKQYKYERDLYEKKVNIAPTVTRAEFEKILK